jgi:hypothetical protein
MMSLRDRLILDRHQTRPLISFDALQAGIGLGQHDVQPTIVVLKELEAIAGNSQ